MMMDDDKKKNKVSLSGDGGGARAHRWAAPYKECAL